VKEGFFATQLSNRHSWQEINQKGYPALARIQRIRVGCGQMTVGRIALEAGNLQRLFDALTQRGYSLVGPTIRQGAIVYDHLTAVTDLPVGWTDEQSGGYYRLKKNGTKRFFDYSVGPQSWRHFLLPSAVRLWHVNCRSKNLQVSPEKCKTDRYAFIGVRSCEIHAIAIQDEVFLKSRYSDPRYEAQREGIFVVAVNCNSASRNCFCGSMKTGPKVTIGYDLALTEVVRDDSHILVVDVGSENGSSVMNSIQHRAATEAESNAADKVSEQVVMHKVLDTDGIKEVLYRNYDNPRWMEVANRCLTCGNCTLVCPTCFCTTVYDATDLSGRRADRWRKWDSCFTVDFSYIHGGSIRPSPMSRYRQWMVHKLGSWIDQFGSSGCVGCGRCITWCPVGIDITEEARVIRESEKTMINHKGGMKIANA
jgi:sulfhydrogenase subunit beta (sulfur reductase)